MQMFWADMNLGGGTLFNPLPCCFIFLCVWQSSARQFHVRINWRGTGGGGGHVGGQMAYVPSELIQKSLEFEVRGDHLPQEHSEI